MQACFYLLLIPRLLIGGSFSHQDSQFLHDKNLINLTSFSPKCVENLSVTLVAILNISKSVLFSPSSRICIASKLKGPVTFSAYVSIIFRPPTGRVAAILIFTTTLDWKFILDACITYSIGVQTLSPLSSHFVAAKYEIHTSCNHAMYEITD